MIKVLKKDNQVFENFEEKTLDENGSEVWNIPTNLDEFKQLAKDTFEWQIGRSVLKTAGGKQVDLSASNSKAITLLAKVLNSLNPNLDNLTDLEKDSYNLLLSLAYNGYSDSEKLKNSLTSVSTNISKYTDKIVRTMSASSHDEVIAILNEE